MVDFTTIAEQLLFTTFRVETTSSSGEAGLATGFVFTQERSEETGLVLVTNKHVVEGAEFGRILFNRSDGSQPILGDLYAFEINEFENLWKGHPDPDVDITVAPFPPLLQLLGDNQIFYKSIPDTLVPSTDDLNNLDAFEECIFVGYPNGIWDAANNLPVTRRGMTATHPAVDFEGDPVFLLDASVFPGSSGSPVFLYNQGAFPKTKGGPTTVGTRVMFLGVIAEVFFREEEGELIAKPVPTSVLPVPVSQEMLDLGVVFKAATVIEAMEHHFPWDAAAVVEDDSA